MITPKHNAIWKYEIIFKHGETEIEMPKGAVVLSVGNQNDTLCVWAKVNTFAETETRRFHCYLTGIVDAGLTVAETSVFLGTVLFGRGAFVVHVFEVA